MKIEVIWNDDTELYDVKVDGNIILTCLSDKDVNELTLGEITECVADMYA